MALREIAFIVQALPYLDLPGVIDFREIKNRPALRAALHRSPGVIEPSLNEIQIADGIAEYPCAIGTLTGVE